MNKDIISDSLEYHENTKHSEISVMTSPHYLDWNNRPYPFKIYTDLDSISLPSDFPLPSMNAILAINKSTFQYKHQDQDKDKSEYETDNNIANIKTKTKIVTLKDLAEILFFSAGITREIKYDDNNIFYMRAASATGALYPIEVYVVCKDIDPNLKTGVYHFSPAQFSLTRIRNGDYTSLLASIVSDDNQDILNSNLTIILTSYAWRNAWKYQDRSYRHWFWDSGVIAANLLAITSSMENNTSAKIHLGFIDGKVNQLLALEKDKEATVAIISLYVKPSSNSNTKVNSITIEKLVDTPLPRTIPLSKREQKFPLIWKTHDRSKFSTIEEVKEWTKAGITQINNSISSNKTIIKRQYLTNEYQQQQQQLSNIPSIGETILKRGSTRKFSRSSITLSNLSSILYNSTRGISMDYKKDKESLIDIYLILNDVKGIDSGGYFYNRFDNSLDLIKDKASRELSAYLCLGQSLFGDASAVLFLMSNLSKTIEILGNRGYRAAQFEACVIAGKIYLLAYAHAIGASGSTFYDDAVTEFFLPHAENKNTMIAVGIGNPDYKSRPGKILPVKFSKEQLLEKAKYIIS